MQILSIACKKRIHAIAFSLSGMELAGACGDGQLRVWDLMTGEVRHSLPIEETSCGYDLAYLDDHRLIFVGVDLRWWDISSNQWNVISPGVYLRQWGREIRLSPDRRFLAEVGRTTSMESRGENLLLYETSNWKQLPSPVNSRDTTGGLAFSNDGKWLATGHIVRDEERTRHLRYDLGRVTASAYDYVVHVREFPSGEIVQSVSGWRQGVSHLAFSRDATVLAGTAGPRLRIWDIKGDREVVLHNLGPKHFQGLSFTVDGRYLATVSNDRTVRVWNTISWQEHTTFTWKIGKLLNIAFAPDGCRAAAGSDGGKVVIWDVDD